ncbi:DUF6268 family outer membrane beta-barrel protein [Spirosoma montaniterrae]|uniref:DUF6268 family outer membrane beta-barrel protein n=1 Tax=Spirosoma montaniterrae TaxID=1178516 RepID=UPI001E3EE192|nr:DUF6268 family outer membrane beta-barrel protein [Spirosoma montaniterrae]
MKALPILLLALLATGSSLAQTAPVPAAVPQSTTSPAEAAPAAEELNFDEFGDADDKKVKLFATQKVLYLSPTKLISVGYEAQTGFDLTSNGNHMSTSLPIGPTDVTQPVNRFGGLRLGVNTPVISRSNFILNLGFTYWNTGVSIANPEQSRLFGALNQGLRSTGVNATVFKPLDIKHFLLLQANADLNGTYRNFSELDSRGMTYSGTAIYGWKPNDNLMWGLGVTRTYRAGQVLHIPVLFYNRTFNPRWGVEAILPARANLRRNFGTNSLLMLGYEIEGNAYYLGSPTGTDLYLRRGELKPRITYERKIAGFIWLSAQAGIRYNWRFDAFRTQNPTANETVVFANSMPTVPYVNVSLNLVSP